MCAFARSAGHVIMQLIFFFKQKTAYEMRISDWSSDVCSSDLGVALGDPAEAVADAGVECRSLALETGLGAGVTALRPRQTKIGRASCRERVCQYVSISGVAVSLKKKHKIHT